MIMEINGIKNYKARHTSRCFDVEYSYNNVGARDYDDYILGDTKKSVMLIGDSFAAGYGVKLIVFLQKLLKK